MKLTPKALAVLRVFLTRPGQVVTKDELLQTVWSGTAVSDAALTSCIQELRQALRDDPRKPRYIETAHRRGFCFIAPLTAAPPVSGSRFQVPPSTQPLAPNPQREAEVEVCFLKAIEIARRQSTKSMELRAVMSLAWLWQSQGKKIEAHRMLAEIYGWFTEGFDTADLQEAKALLDELL